METRADFNDLAFSPNGEKFISVHDIPDEKTNKEYYQAIFLWETKTKTILKKWSPYQNRSWKNNVECCAFHPSGKVIAIGGEDNNVRLWSLISGKEIALFEGHEDNIADCNFSSDGRYLVSVGHDLLVIVWDLRTKKKLHVLQGHTQNIRTCSFTPNGQRVVSAGDDDLLIIWDMKDGKRLGTLTGHSDNIRDCSISPDGRTIVTTSKDQTVKIWEIDAYKNKNPHLLANLDNIIYHMSISPDNQNLFVGIKGVLGVKCLNATTGKVKNFSDNSYPFQGIFASASQTIFTKDGQTLIMAGYDKSITIWDVASGKKRGREFANGKKMATFISHDAGVRSCSLNSDESLLASCDKEGWVVIWDFHSGQELNKYRHRKGEVNFVKFSPDGKTLASCSEDDTVILWDVEKRKIRHVFREHPQEVFMLDFDQKGDRIISSSEGKERNLILWNSRTGEVLARYENHIGDVNACQFSPNGKRILSAGEDKTICIWDAHPKTKEENLRQRPLLILKGQGEVESCFFSADGSKIYSAYGNGEIRLWDASLSE